MELDKKKMPKLNLFFVQDEDGDYYIPTLEINGHDKKMAFIPGDQLEVLKEIAADISIRTGLKFHYLEFTEPSIVEAIEPKKSNLAETIPKMMEVIRNMMEIVESKAKHETVH